MDSLAKPVALPYGSDLYKRIVGDPGWIAQEKVDGMRVVVSVRHSGIHAYSRHGRKVELPPKVMRSLEGVEWVATLDCELKGDELHVLDLITVDGRGIMHEPFSRRQMRGLNLMWHAGEAVKWVRTVKSEDADARYTTWVREGAEGIVLKKLGDGYPPNGGAQWFKVKPGL